MKTYLILFALAAFFNKKDDSRKTNPESVFIYETSPKIYGRSDIGFVVIQDSTIVKIASYRIYFSDLEIKKINKGEAYDERLCTFKKDKEGNVSVTGIGTVFNEDSFAKHKINSDKLYALLDPRFLALSNRERLEVLENLVLKYPDK